ncbi:hypothetical protein SEA_BRUTONGASTER_124 [Gordonia phage BrutonGaster]|uniref:Uncharacterized protein n=1 Tax=Gordonia phage BrutonGaster TaxID=2530116 RepID=A0A482JLP8_9CAUD|nr:hypothetical protein HOV26_gp058 [Gordonia phage BrutonGaster]QBP33339.1 hypothetical protein SEA_BRUTONGASTER_124 [Gordonia phage BrutonGaster]
MMEFDPEDITWEQECKLLRELRDFLLARGRLADATIPGLFVAIEELIEFHDGDWLPTSLLSNFAKIWDQHPGYNKMWEHL